MLNSINYPVVVADPAWPFLDKLPGKSRGAANNYDSMTMAQIMEYGTPLRGQGDSVLFLWRVASMQEEALAVCRHWGYRPYTEMVWNKLTKNGKPWFGMGRLIRNSHESILIGVQGKPKRKLANIRSTFSAQYTRHSGKPEAFFDIIESLLDGPYLELFARRKRDGWICLGREVE